MMIQTKSLPTLAQLMHISLYGNWISIYLTTPYDIDQMSSTDLRVSSGKDPDATE
jgi:hypothetical protein